MTRNSPAKILIVDDDASNVQLIEAMLRADKYLTFGATSGKEALRLAAEVLPDLILLDIMMPEMNGFEVAQKIKADLLTHSISIIMITALDDRESRLFALQVGAEEFITKPVDRSELTLRVRNILMLREYKRLLALQGGPSA